MKKKNQPTAITINEQSTIFLYNWSKKVKLRFFLFFYFCLHPDPKQIIPGPDPGKVPDPTESRSGFITLVY